MRGQARIWLLWVLPFAIYVVFWLWYTNLDGPIAVNQAMDLVGLEGAESWTPVALMRYRSRRDLIQIATAPAFNDRHDYKIAALEKTIAVTIEPTIYFSDPRLLLTRR